MAEKMLIDASHEEETRVVVVRGNRIEEFDFESQHKKQLRGNIYLAKVTRVEPSLQAAFVEYGGNRHGFLAFSEIHPDYYQIPLADRQALLQAEAEAEKAEAESENDDAETDSEPAAQASPAAKPKARRSRSRKKAPEPAEEEAAAKPDVEDGSSPDEMLAAVDVDSVSEHVHGKSYEDDDNGNGHKVDSVGAEDALEEVPDRSRKKPRRQYRIQEVIKRRQILLVQVVKEERGNKGAALTTYLSLAGRYSVLMPNTARGGGISRKITNVQDRKRLKEVARGLEVPQGMGVILRTAGANRTKAEVKRDFEYLMRLWETVRSLTLTSKAPTLVYEEGSLIKRSIRDLYNKDISEIIVSGEEGYREAKTFMKMLMPSHAKVVQPYRDIHPIYTRSNIESQLDRMLQPQVTLKSGGYVIINQTEALVAIDVNSGRSTKEHSIEDTALQTNLEAAEEVARQLRLRDLAGLIVIDFIDMEENRNNRSVEKKLKECLKHDRARIQVGRISHFGLLEMSRQRIRASVLESTTQTCEACGGTGHVRSKSSVALHVVRGIEEYLLKNTTHNITVRALPETALYLLNQKRDTIVDLEARFGLSIVIESDPDVGSQHFAIDRGDPVDEPVNVEEIVQFNTPLEEDAADGDEAEDEVPSDQSDQAPQADDDTDGSRRKRRRRRRGGRSGDDESEDATAAQETEASSDDESDDEGRQRKRRRRGKRGGRRKRTDERPENQHEPAHADASDGNRAEASGDNQTDASGGNQAEATGGNGTAEVETERLSESQATEKSASVTEEPGVAADEAAAEAPKRKRTRRSKPKAEKPETGNKDAAAPSETHGDTAEVAATGSDAGTDNAARAEPASEPPEQDGKPEDSPTQRRRSEKSASEPVVTSSQTPSKEDTSKKPKKAGWWQRRGFF